MTLLAGGVGGARMARALRAVLDPGHLTVVVNVGDNTERYGVRVDADPDTVLYTLAGVAGPAGWGRAGDTTNVMTELARFGIDTTFTLGDADFGVCVARSQMMEAGRSLSDVTAHLARGLGVDDVDLLVATDDPLATLVQIEGRVWLDFQEYFVDRGHRDEVTALAYHGAVEASPAPGVVEAIGRADTVVIAPSNPPLSIWPILAIDGIEQALRSRDRRVAVSPLFSGRALKGPAAEVMRAVGLSAGTLGVLEAYAGLIDQLYVDSSDANDAALGEAFDVSVLAADTRLDGDDLGAAFAYTLLQGADR